MDKPRRDEAARKAAARRRLQADSREASEALDRHPDDGWVLADPMPMGEGTRRALRAMIRAVCPPEPAPQLPDLEDRIEVSVRRMLPYMPPLMGRGFAVAVHLLDWAPVWRLAAPRRMRSLPPERVLDVLNGMSHSRLLPLRQLSMVVRAAVLSAYFDQREVHDAMGFVPQPFMRERVRLRRRLAEGEIPGEGDLIGPYSSEVAP